VPALSAKPGHAAMGMAKGQAPAKQAAAAPSAKAGKA
jgi:hypothetical protein